MAAFAAETVDAVNISTANQLAALLSNEHSAKSNARLTCDIDMLGKTVTPDIYGYNATFDGNGHAVTNLTISNEGPLTAIFRNIGTKGIVNNLDLSNVSITANADTEVWTQSLGDPSPVLKVNAFNKELKWESNDPSVVSVDHNGLITVTGTDNGHWS